MKHVLDQEPTTGSGKRVLDNLGAATLDAGRITARRQHDDDFDCSAALHTLNSLLGFYGDGARGIIWEHNSHVGDAGATEMSARGEFNVGHLCRTQFGSAAYLIGFGTDHGTVAAASNWDEPVQQMSVRPSHPASYERLFHESDREACILHLRKPRRQAVRDELMEPRLERAIGVIYRPETELASHYFQAVLPEQFDEYIWFDETQTVGALEARQQSSGDLPDTYPFGL